MTVRWEKNTLVVHGAPTGGSSAWAVCPGVVFTASWFLRQPEWWREKVMVHEREHFDEEALMMALGAVAGLLLTALTGWAWWAEAVAVAGASQVAWYGTYLAAPKLRSRWELRAEAAEKAWMVENGHWKVSGQAVKQVLDRHEEAYYRSKDYLWGEPPRREWLWARFVGYLREEGVEFDVHQLQPQG